MGCRTQRPRTPCLMNSVLGKSVAWRVQSSLWAPIAASLGLKPQHLLTLHFGRAQHPQSLNSLSIGAAHLHQDGQPFLPSGSWPSPSRPWESLFSPQRWVPRGGVCLSTAIRETRGSPLRAPDHLVSFGSQLSDPHGASRPRGARGLAALRAPPN